MPTHGPRSLHVFDGERAWLKHWIDGAASVCYTAYGELRCACGRYRLTWDR